MGLLLSLGVPAISESAVSDAAAFQTGCVMQSLFLQTQIHRCQSQHSQSNHHTHTPTAVNRRDQGWVCVFVYFYSWGLQCVVTYCKHTLHCLSQLMHVAIELEWCHCLLFSAFDVKTNAALSRVPWWLCSQHRNNGFAREYVSHFNQYGWRQTSTCHPLFRSTIHRLLSDKKGFKMKAISTLCHHTWIITAKHTTQRCNRLLLLKVLAASWITEILNTPPPLCINLAESKVPRSTQSPGEKCRKQPPSRKEGEVPHVNSVLCCKHIQNGPVQRLDHLYLKVV